MSDVYEVKKREKCTKFITCKLTFSLGSFAVVTVSSSSSDSLEDDANNCRRINDLIRFLDMISNSSRHQLRTVLQSYF